MLTVEEVFGKLKRVNKLTHLLTGDHTIKVNKRQARCKGILTRDQHTTLLHDIAPLLKYFERPVIEHSELIMIDEVCDIIVDKMKFAIPAHPKGKLVDDVYIEDKKKPAVIRANFTQSFVDWFMADPSQTP